MIFNFSHKLCGRAIIFFGLSYTTIALQNNIGAIKKNKFLENFLILLCLLVLFINVSLLFKINLNYIQFPLYILVF